MAEAKRAPSADHVRRAKRWFYFTRALSDSDFEELYAQGLIRPCRSGDRFWVSKTEFSEHGECEHLSAGEFLTQMRERTVPDGADEGSPLLELRVDAGDPTSVHVGWSEPGRRWWRREKAWRALNADAKAKAEFRQTGLHV